MVAQVMTAEPYASAGNVYWIVDNDCSDAELVLGFQDR